MGSVAYDYRCKVVRWLDGDTLDVDIDLGFSISLRQRVRVYGINCPESKSRNKEEKTAGLAAKSFAEDQAPMGSVVTIRSHKAGDDDEKFGRWLAEVKVSDGDFAGLMLSNKHARAYTGGKREPWTPI